MNTVGTYSILYRLKVKPKNKKIQINLHLDIYSKASGIVPTTVLDVGIMMQLLQALIDRDTRLELFESGMVE